MRERVGIALSAAAVAGVGAIGVWMGLAATSVPTVDLGDTVNDTVLVTTGTHDAGPAVEWRLHRNGDVTLIASLAAPGIAIPELRDDPVEITGHPLQEWSTSLAGQSTARSPRMLFATGETLDAVLPFGATTPGAYSTLTAVLEAGPRDLLDLTVTPAGDIVESTSVMVESNGDEQWVDSVTWSLTYRGLAQQFFLDEGLARWTDPSGQTFMQLLLLLSGALIGVAASLAVERLFSWTLQVREAAAREPLDAEGAPPEGDAP